MTLAPPTAASLQRKLAEAEARLADHVRGARRANLLLTLSVIALLMSLFFKVPRLPWIALAGLLLGAAEILRRIRLITLARDERLDLMMALAAVASTPSEGSPR
ncbi:MAG TPA: hypothetical protein VJ600_00785 [Holophagaceae bacterium]|nr:hypothetical protein [Holophagaceae bacterium]